MSSYVAYNGEFDPSKPWLCSECQKAFRQKGHLQDHIESNHIPGISYSCPFCETEVSSRASLRSHVSQKHQRQQKEYKVKIHQIQPNFNPAVWVLTRTFCFFICCSQINDIPGVVYAMHLIDHILELESLIAPLIAFDGQSDPSKPWHCTECSKTFKKRDHLKDHIEGSHITGLSFTCPYCSLAITSRHRLRTHISIKHNVEHKRSHIKISHIQPNV